MPEQPHFEHSHTVHLANYRGTGLKLILEPWLEEFEIPPGEAFDIVGLGIIDGSVEIVVHDNYVAAWPWRQATLIVKHNGKELGEPRDAPLR